MLNKQQEEFLHWLLSQKRDINNTTSISNAMTTYPKNYTEKDVIQRLNELENYELISIKWLGTNRSNLDNYVTISFSKDALNYFDNKKNDIKENKRRRVETYGIAIMSLIALLKSFDKELISLWKQLMQLLQ